MKEKRKLLFKQMQTVSQIAATNSGLDLMNMQPVRCCVCKKTLLEVSVKFKGIVRKKCPNCKEHNVIYDLKT
jgi:phage FluMu protein Com